MPNPREPGWSRDQDLEKARGLKRPADAEMDATDRSDDPKPDEHIDYPADVDDDADQPDRETLADSGQ